MNPFTNARVIATDTNPDVYHRTGRSKGDAPRGHPEFIMSRSELMDFASCPRKWKAGIPETHSDATQWGNLMDCLVTCPKEFDQRYVVTPKTCKATKTMACVKSGEASPGDDIPWNPMCAEAKEWKSAKEQAGFTVMSLDDDAGAKQGMKALEADDIAWAYIQSSLKQVMCMADYCDTATGLVVPIKILIDFVPIHERIPAAFAGRLWHKTLGDYKTARSAAEAPWRKAVFDHGYHIQGALYLAIYRAATGEDRCDFNHVVQENTEPYHTELLRLGEGAGVDARHESDIGFLAIGENFYLSALKEYCHCLKTGQWGGYYRHVGPEMKRDGFVTVHPLPWMVTAHLHDSWTEAPTAKPADEPPVERDIYA